MCQPVAEMRQICHQAGLSPREAQVFLLTTEEQLTPGEIAARLGIRVECVRVHLCRGRRRILEAAGEWWDRHTREEDVEDLVGVLRGAAS